MDDSGRIAPQTAAVDLVVAMSDQQTFEEFLRRIRAGDSQAAGELVQRFEPLIRTEVRLRLSDPRLFRLFDSMDICQSVLGSFFVRAAAGGYDLEHPEQLVKLLLAITRNKLAHRARREYRQRRDVRRMETGPVDCAGVATEQDSPSACVAGAELLEAFRGRLSPEEREIAGMRADGLAWQTIAERLGGSPQSRRKQLARAIDRVSAELGLDN